MMKKYPYFPKPIKSKTTLFTRYLKNNRSWLDALYARSYTMKMGQFKLPLVELYIPNEPELIHRIMVSEFKLFPKHSLQHKMLTPLLGESIFTTNGAKWKKQRELLNPSFDMVKVSHVFELMNQATKDMLIRLEQRDSNKYEDIDTEMTFVTADIIFRTILSKKLTEAEGKKIVNAFSIFQERSAKITMQEMFRVPNFFRKKSVEQEYISSAKLIRQILSDIVKPRYEDAIDHKKSTPKEDILASLLKIKDKDTRKPFSFVEILDQVSMLFLAGHETSASSLTWTIYLLALYPEYQEKAYSEILLICQKSEFSIDNTKKLIFLNNIFKESLRLYPPVSFFPRETVEETKMRDKVLPKGSVVVISPWLMHRNERYWEDPHMFNPHRFDEPKNIIKNTYFPFGMGQRVCIGSTFAIQESILVLATILRSYKLELKPNFTPDIVGRLTTRSINGMPIKFIRR